MTSPFEREPRATPLEAFSDAVRTRQDELEFLLENLEAGLELISDLEEVNAIIGESPRPELILVDRVEQLEINWPYEPRQIHNFIVNLRGFGPRIEEMRGEQSRSGEEIPTLVGRRLPTREELEEYFLMGARGNRAEHHAFAEANGIARSTAEDMLMNTLVNKPAFMRMWILFPELTEYLMTKCLDDRKEPTNIDEEIFVGYSLMSLFVDKNDRKVIKKDGSIDAWSLCH